LLFSLFMWLFFMLIGGIAVLCVLLHISVRVYGIPPLAIGILGIVFSIPWASRVIEAEPITNGGERS
jgi:hypothetical protein